MLLYSWRGFGKQKTSAWTCTITDMEYRIKRVRKLGAEEVPWEVTAFEVWVWRRMLKISWTEWKTNKWIPEKIGIPEEKGILEQIKHRKLSKYCHWKRSDSVVLATIEGEIEGKFFPGRRRTAWINDVRRWTGDDMNVARINAMERRYDFW